MPSKKNQHSLDFQLLLHRINSCKSSTQALLHCFPMKMHSRTHKIMCSFVPNYILVFVFFLWKLCLSLQSSIAVYVFHFVSKQIRILHNVSFSRRENKENFYSISQIWWICGYVCKNGKTIFGTFAYHTYMLVIWSDELVWCDIITRSRCGPACVYHTDFRCCSLMRKV